MHNIYDFTIFIEGYGYEVAAGVEEDMDGSDRPLISIEIEDGDDAREVIRILGEERLKDRIRDLYNDMRFDRD